MTVSPATCLLRDLGGLLDGIGVPYMVVGSFASTFHGEPRTTQDVDLVIDPSEAQLEQLLDGLDASRFYFDADAARDALRRRTLFNVIEVATAWKVDLVIRKARPFSLEELRRRQTATVLDAIVPVATAEDTIIAKLEWARAGGSDRQLEDVAGILRVRGAGLDRAYLERWITTLGLDAAWRRAQALA